MTNDVTWLQRCCEAVQSAILATAWLLLLIHLHQGLLLSSANADVNKTAVELDVALKILCLSPPPRCASATNYKGVCDSQTRHEHGVTLRMMMMTVSDSGSTYYNCFMTCWAVWNHTISLLSNIMLALLWFHWKRRWQFFKQSRLCVYMLHVSAAAIHDKGLTTCQETEN